MYKLNKLVFDNDKDANIMGNENKNKDTVETHLVNVEETPAPNEILINSSGQIIAVGDEVKNNDKK